MIAFPVVLLIGICAITGFVVLVKALFGVGRNSETRGGNALGTVFALGIMLLGFLALPMLFYARTQAREMPPAALEHAGYATAPAVRVTIDPAPAASLEKPMSSEGREFEEPEVDLDTEQELTAEAPSTLPDWATTEPDRQQGLHVVLGDWFPSRKKAERDALAKATDLLMTEYRSQNTGVRGWQPRIESLETSFVSKRHTEEQLHDYGAVPGADADDQDDAPIIEGMVYRTHLLVRTSDDVKHAVYRQWKHDVRQGRLEEVTLTAGGFVGAIALLALYFRVEKRGFVRRSARGVALLGALGLGTASTLAAVEGLGTPAHEGPARLETQLDHVSVDFDEVRYARACLAIDGLSLATFNEIPPFATRKTAFLVLGDEQLGTDANIDLLCNEISRFESDFDGQYKLFCESDKGSPTRVQGVPLIRQTLRTRFTSGAGSVFPRNAVHNVLQYEPDNVILIRNSDAGKCRGQKLTGSKLAQLFEESGLPITVHVVELGNSSDGRVDLRNLARRTGGEHVVWNGQQDSDSDDVDETCLETN